MHVFKTGTIYPFNVMFVQQFEYHV